MAQAQRSEKKVPDESAVMKWPILFYSLPDVGEGEP